MNVFTWISNFLYYNNKKDGGWRMKDEGTYCHGQVGSSPKIARFGRLVFKLGGLR